jgi:cold shock CspA family protein
VNEQESGFRTLNDGEMGVYSASQGAKGWAATKARSLTRVPAAGTGA